MYLTKVGYDKWLGNSTSYESACDYRDLRAGIGTTVHNHAEDYNNGLEVNIDPPDEEVAKYMMSYERWYKDMIDKHISIEASEIKLYHPKLPFSGTFDMVTSYTFKDKLCIDLVDIKTGDYRKSHELQLTAYAMLWNKVFPDYPVSNIYGLYLKSGWKKEPNYTFKKLKLEPELVLNACNLWSWMHTSARGVSPGPRTPKVYDYKFKRAEDMIGVVDEYTL